MCSCRPNIACCPPLNIPGASLSPLLEIRTSELPTDIRLFSHDQLYISPPPGAPRGQPMNGPRGHPLPGAANAPRGSGRPNSATNPGPRGPRPASITPNGAGGVHPPMPGHPDAHAPGTPQRPGLPASSSFTHQPPPTPSSSAAGPHSVSSSVMRPPSRTASVDSTGPSLPQRRVCPRCLVLTRNGAGRHS